MARAVLPLRGAPRHLAVSIVTDHRGAARLAVLCAALAACDAFYAVGPEGCDERNPCKGAGLRCDLIQRRCVVNVTEGPEPPRACQRHATCPSQVCDTEGVVSPQPGLCVPVADTTVVETAADLFVALQRARAARIPAGTFRGEFQVHDRAVILVGSRGSDEARRQGAAPTVLMPTPRGGSVLKLSGAAQVLVDGVTLRGAPDGSGGHGVECQDPTGRLWLRRVEINETRGRGVQAACPLSIDQSVIGAWQGQKGNWDGGVYAASDVTLRNSFILGNGNPNSQIGALGLIAPPGNTTAKRDLAHLTLADNRSGYIGCAIQCVNGEISPLWHSLTFNNYGQAGKPSLGQCLPHAAATDEPMSVHGPTVDLSIDNPPRFRALGDGHLHPDSPVIDRVSLMDGGPAIPYDFDGEPRPAGARADYGADEYHPPM